MRETNKNCTLEVEFKISAGLCFLKGDNRGLFGGKLRLDSVFQKHKVS